MPALDNIEVGGFKSIREMSLDLRSLNILIGANGSGKSNFISIFEMLDQLVHRNLQTYIRSRGGASSILRFGPKTTQEIAINLRFGNRGYSAKLAFSDDDSLFFSAESTLAFPMMGISNRQVFESGHRESKLLTVAGEMLDNRVKAMWGESYALQIADAIAGWKVYHFHDTTRNASVKLRGDIGDLRVLQADASNLAAILYFLQRHRNEYYTRIVRTIRLVAPFFDDFALHPDADNPDKIRLEWHEKGSSTNFNANSLSDGTLRFMCLATLLLQPNLPSTILIDEPELGLHPYALTLLASMLRSTATKTQIIVSTQSVPLVNQFSPEDVIVVDREDNQSVFKRLQSQDLESWLEDYGLGELWEKNVIGGRPR